MSTTKVTPQKVIAVLKKAGLKVERKSSRFGSGYDVSGIYAEYPMIEIGYNGGDARRSGSYTANKIEKLTSAASVLLEAGITVLMNDKILNGKWNEDVRDHELLTLFVRKDGAPQTDGAMAHWDVDEITNYFSDKITAELSYEAEEQAKKDAQRLANAKSQAERLARVNLLNPTIGIDLNYLEGLFTTHVTLLDGRLAVLTVAYTSKEEFDWDAPTVGNEHAKYNCFEVELTYIAPDRSNPIRWERGTSNFTTGKDENINDGIRYWISRQ